MHLSIAKVEGIHTLVVSLTGVILGLLLGWGYLHLEREQSRLSEDNLSMSDLVRLEDTLRQWLLMGDLVYGSGVTYLIEGAESQGLLAASVLEQLAQSPLATTSVSQISTLSDILNRNSERLQLAAGISPENEVELASDLLIEWDEDAAVSVGLLQNLKQAMTSQVELASASVSGFRRMLLVMFVLAGVFYAALVFAMWRWVNTSMVNPLVKLTEATDEALDQQTHLELEEAGPEEVRRLTRSARALIGNLENQVSLRTQELKLREEQLECEMLVSNKAQQAAARAQREAEAASMAKSEFLANMSHEIRTPLNGVLGGAELALEEAENEEQKETLSLIVSSGKQLLGVINDILDFSKLDAGEVKLIKEEVNLTELLTTTARIFAVPAAQKGVELILEADPHLPKYVVGDSLRLGQILNNLASNAVKFTETGEIIIRAAAEPQADATLLLQLDVIDTGIGISTSQQQAIFKPFQQADSTSTKRIGGTGLGLSISQRFVELMGGEICVHSEPGKGSTFTCSLPLEQSARCESYGAHKLDGSFRVNTHSHSQQSYLEKLMLVWGLEVAEDDSEKADILVADLDLLPDGPLEQFCEHAILLTQPGHSGENSKSVTYLAKPICADSLFEAATATNSLNTPVSKATRSEGQGMNVLVVEDNLVNQVIVKKSLSMLGCEVQIAADGQAGIDAIQKKAFDLVLMDWHMPDMDGLEATRRTRVWESEQQKQHTLIYALTANAMEGDEEQCLAAGMDGYLSKPVNLSALRSALHEASKLSASAVKQST